MSQVSAKLRRAEGRFIHWCTGCKQMHPLPDDGWSFDGKVDAPTFSPSFKQTIVRFDAGLSPEGVGLGQRRELICHYIITAGKLVYQADCFHSLAAQTVPMPDLPE